MTTTATIVLPNSDWFAVGSDGTPSTLVPILEDIIQEVVEISEDKYKRPEEEWVQELQSALDNHSAFFKPDYYAEGDYHYEVTEDQSVQQLDA